MNRWKKNLIWLFTFAFGLIWVMAFLLPSEIGGGIDRHGMYAPDLFGKRLYYTTGVRKTEQPLAEHSAGAFIAMMDLDNTDVRRQAIAASITRRDDYKGAKRPQVFQSGPNEFHMFYIGLGSDDRARICMADSGDGTHWIPKDAALFDPPQEISKEGVLNYSVSVDHRSIYYVVIDKGQGVVRLATQNEQGNWTDRGLFKKLPEPQSIISFSEMPDGNSLAVSKSEDEPAELILMKGEKITILTPVMNIDGTIGTLFNKPPPRFLEEIVDAKIESDGNVLRALITGGSKKDGRARTAIYEGTPIDNLALVRTSRPDGSIAALSKEAHTTYFNDWAGSLADFVPIVSAFGFGLGLISLLGVHGRRIRKGGEPAFYSSLVLIAMLMMLIVQLAFNSQGKPETGPIAMLNDLLFYRLQFPLGATMFGLLAAYLVSAAYRAFRIRSFDAAVLAAMAAFVMLTQVPTGQFLASLFAPAKVAAGAALDMQAVEGRNWALSIANDAVQRAVGFGAFVGAIAMAMRVWLSLDRTSRE